MPKWLHREIARSADKKGLTGARRDRYIYGTMNKLAEKSPFKKWRKKRH